MKKIIMSIVLSMMFIGCGGGGSSSDGTSSTTSSSGGSSSDGTVPVNSETSQTIAINKIKAYANDSTQPTPTIQDYLDAGVTGVTAENILDINAVVEGLIEEDVDTQEEIQALADDLGVVIPTNSAPIATFSTFSTNEDVVYNGTLTSSDADNNAVTYIKVSEPLNGMLTVNATGDFSYTPKADYYGTDSFVYKVNDGIEDSITKQVNITVNPINDKPMVADISVSGHSRSILDDSISASDVEQDVFTYTIKTAPAFGLFTLDETNGNFTFKPQSATGSTKAVIEVSDGNSAATLDINFYISQMQIGSAIQMCDSYKQGSNYFNVEDGLIQLHSSVTLNITNTLDSNISISSGKLYNGNTEVYSAGSPSSGLKANHIAKTSATYVMKTSTFNNYWIIKFKDVATNTNYIAKYTYDSLEGMTISSSNSIYSSGTIGCHDDTPYNGSYIIEEDLGFDIASIEDIMVSETKVIPISLNDAIINNGATVTVSLEPSEGMTAIYSDGKITFELVEGEAKADTYTVIVTADKGANSDKEVFYAEYALHHDVSTTTEFREALVDAAQNGVNDVIILADGIYKTTDDGLGEFRFADNEAYKLMIKGSSPDNVILSGANTDRVLYLYNTFGGTSFNIENISVENGYVDGYGAGIWSSSHLYIDYTTVRNNRAPGASRGGGLYLDSNNRAHLYLKNSLIENNSGYLGGGFYVHNISTNSEIRNSIIRNNIANQGGGFYSGHTQIYNSIISSNIAEDPGSGYTGGGAFYTFSSLSLVNSLVVNNSTGILTYDGDTNYVVNSILSNNGIYDYKTDGASSVNIINSYTDGVLDITHFDTDVMTSGDLSFVDEANGNFRLNADSVLIDAGTNEYHGVEILPTDMDGNSRPSGSTVDIGPYEYQQ